MIDAHKTLIGRCAPLVKKVLEMVAIESFSKDPLPEIQLPVQLFLCTLYVRIRDPSRASSHESVRIPDWWETFFFSAGSGGGSVEMRIKTYP